tara:strand:- start:67 stop:282 length:216 start_codon:yes stop_codon:yes gene_type:complete
MEKYGEKKIIIQKRTPNFLMKKMIRDGLDPIEIEVIKNKNFSIHIIPIEPNQKEEIDSALVVKAGEHSFLI